VSALVLPFESILFVWTAGDKCLDVGCGIGGPLREIALFSGAHVTGARRQAHARCIGKRAWHAKA
jgi:2-polyprenyl-3-methyl-5-hydroxy-6-metoxy-1,4-benzoquinol methylase